MSDKAKSTNFRPSAKILAVGTYETILKRENQEGKSTTSPVSTEKGKVASGSSFPRKVARGESTIICRCKKEGERVTCHFSRKVARGRNIPCSTRGRILNLSAARGHLTPFYFLSNFKRLLKFVTYSRISFNPLEKSRAGTGSIIFESVPLTVSALVES